MGRDKYIIYVSIEKNTTEEQGQGSYDFYFLRPGVVFYWELFYNDESNSIVTIFF